MKAQYWFVQLWVIVSQWVSRITLSPSIRRCTLCLVMFCFALGLFLIGIAPFHVSGLVTLHSQVATVLHQLTKIPFGGPW